MRNYSLTKRLILTISCSRIHISFSTHKKLSYWSNLIEGLTYYPTHLWDVYTLPKKYQGAHDTYFLGPIWITLPVVSMPTPLSSTMQYYLQ